MSDETYPVGQLSNKKKLVETATTQVVAELVASWAQTSTAIIGLLGASTAVVGHFIADASTAKIGALQPSTEVIGHILADASTAKIGALQPSTEIIGYVKIDQTTPGTSNAITITSSSGGISPVSATAGVKINHYVATPSPGDAVANNENTFAEPSGGSLYLRVFPYALSTGSSWDRTRSIIVANSMPAPSGSVSDVLARLANYNGATHDLQYNNHAVTLLASTSRTATTNSADQTNYNAKAHVLYVAYDTATGAGLTPSVQVKDSVSGLYGTAWTGPAITTGSTGLYTYLLDDAASTSSTGYTDIAKIRFGRTWRLVVTASSSGATQYSASVDNLS
ncbi:MAG: hypothetical protein HYY29_03775 [Chloroflexi bacterium]|nr:hypothetical protein [Chloroflexota bacterium]